MADISVGGIKLPLYAFSAIETPWAVTNVTVSIDSDQEDNPHAQGIVEAIIAHMKTLPNVTYLSYVKTDKPVETVIENP